MRAMRLHQPGSAEGDPLRLEEVPIPEPQAGEVLVRVEACAVCHTDLHIVEGELPPHRLPVIPGHQVVGRVVQAVRDVEAPPGSGGTSAADDRRGGSPAPAAGDRVGVAWLHRACGRCAFCRRGQENLCAAPLFTGYDVDGGYAEYLTAPADFVYPIPEGLSAETAAPLLCAGIIGYRALRLAGTEPGSRLGLFGFGASAHLALQVARSAERRRLAEALGAAWAGGPDDEAPAPLDAAVVFAPAGRVVVDALRRLRPGGTVAVNAIHLDGLPAFDYGLLYGERTIRSVSNATRADGRAFLAIAAAIPVRATVEVMALGEANRALARLRRGQISGAAVLAGS
jgi:propanol-preferring alcohol dehydrogenase